MEKMKEEINGPELHVSFKAVEGKEIDEIPVESEKGNFQVRHDGIILSGSLHLWENIESVLITNLRNGKPLCE